jgi:hypothetical protein
MNIVGSARICRGAVSRPANGRLFKAIAQQAPFLLTQWLTRSAQLAMR